MAIFQRVGITVLLMVYAIYPPGEKWPESIDPALNDSLGQRPVSRQWLRFYLSDLNRGVNSLGELDLFFSGPFAVAAPFLLYRLKRSGFSGSRVTATAKGLVLRAFR